MGVSFNPYEDAKRLLDKIFVIGFKISNKNFLI
jgi:hypothetical protein